MVLIESCACSLFVLEFQCQNGLWSGVMQIQKERVGYWAQGKHLLDILSPRIDDLIAGIGGGTEIGGGAKESLGSPDDVW